MAAVELRTPSFVSLRVPYHQRPCIGRRLQIGVSLLKQLVCRAQWRKKGLCGQTHDKDGQDDSEQQCVRSDDERRVLALDDPRWQGDAGAKLLLAVGVAVQLVIPPAHLVREPAKLECTQYAIVIDARKMNLRLVGLCQLDEMRVGFLLGGIISIRDLVRVAADDAHRQRGTSSAPGPLTYNLSESFR